jgi:hypothetical protein
MYMIPFCFIITIIYTILYMVYHILYIVYDDVTLKKLINAASALP